MMSEEKKRKLIFQNKLVLITGGSSGIGFSMAEKMLQYGSRVIILSLHTQKLLEAQKELEIYGKENIFSVECDIGDIKQIYALKEKILKIGVPDIIVNNAGYSTYRTFEDASLEEIEHMIQVNLNGALRVTHLFIKEMIARGSGRILNISSIAATMLITPNPIYTTCKSGILAWSKGLAIELEPFNIKVQVICPGRVETDFFSHPTFTQRIPRKETAVSTPMKVIIEQIFCGITKGQLIIFTPRAYRFVAWCLSTFAWILEPIYFLILRNRIKTYYEANPLVQSLQD